MKSRLDSEFPQLILDSARQFSASARAPFALDLSQSLTTAPLRTLGTFAHYLVVR